MNDESSVGSSKGHYRNHRPPLGAAEAAILAAIVDGPLAWSSPLEIADRAGVETETALDHLAALDADGWLSVWVRDFGPVVTLSPLAAERLDVRLVERGWGGLPRWSPRGARGDPGARERRRAIEDGADLLDRVIDPDPGPEAQAIAAESPRSNRPTLLIGWRLVPWPGPGALEVCPACLGRPLQARSYCLRCDRAPGDGPDPPRRLGPKPESPRGPSAEELRARRKAARRARRAARGA